jgi:hypothetical protein
MPDEPKLVYAMSTLLTYRTAKRKLLRQLSQMPESDPRRPGMIAHLKVCQEVLNTAPWIEEPSPRGRPRSPVPQDIKIEAPSSDDTVKRAREIQRQFEERQVKGETK